MAEETQEATQSKPQEQRKPNNNRRNNNNRRPNPNQKKNEATTGTRTTNKPNNKNRNRHKRGPSPVDENLKSFVSKNQEAQKQRLNPHYKLDLNSKAKIRVTPLGGLGEIGGNIAVFETDNEAILVDVGMSFPDEDMHGVDILVPDFSYLHEIKNKIIEHCFHTTG